MYRLFFLVRTDTAPAASPAPFSLLVMTFDSALDALQFSLAVMAMQAQALGLEATA
jgi:hypothetical protein